MQIPARCCAICTSLEEWTEEARATHLLSFGPPALWSTLNSFSCHCSKALVWRGVARAFIQPHMPAVAFESLLTRCWWCLLKAGALFLSRSTGAGNRAADRRMRMGLARGMSVWVVDKMVRRTLFTGPWPMRLALGSASFFDTRRPGCWPWKRSVLYRPPKVFRRCFLGENEVLWILVLTLSKP